MNIVYLDNASTTCLRERVLDKILQSMKVCYGNPSSIHSLGRQAKSVIEKARKTVASHIGASPGEIIFTSGGTESNNMIIQGSVYSLGIQTIITSKIEHHAVLNTILKMRDTYGISLEYVDINTYGDIDLEHLEKLLTKDASKKLVSLMHINNEIGNMYDVKAVAFLCQESEALFHSDTVQSIGHWEWDANLTKADFLTASAHKFHGPKGIGFVYIRKETGLGSFIYGGAQERGMRAGTESTQNIIGLEQAIIESYKTLDEERNYIRELKSYFINQLKVNFSNLKFNGRSAELDRSTYNIINVCFLDCPDDKALMLDFQLDIKKIAASKGSACQSGGDEGSHVLNYINKDLAFKKPSLRFSLSHFNTKVEIDYTIKVLREFIYD